MSPVPRIVQLSVGIAALVVMLLLVRVGWSYRTQAVLFAGFALVVGLVALRYERRLPRGGPERTGPDDVMPGARRHVEELEGEGFRTLGGFRWALRGRLVISTVLAPGALDRYAIVTDRVLELASRFGSLTLATTNSGRAPVPEGILRQVVLDGTPTELARAHQLGLDRLARDGLSPDPFLDDEHVLRFVREAEERGLRQGRVPSLATLLAREWSGEYDRELGDDDESGLRIEAWLRARSQGGGA